MLFWFASEAMLAVRELPQMSAFKGWTVGRPYLLVSAALGSNRVSKSDMAKYGIDAMPHYESVRLDAERETAGSVRQEAYVGTKHVGRVQRARGRWIAVTEANDQLQGEFDSPEAAAGALARSISKADTRMQSSATETKITRASARRG
jgi:hypothetical protein